MTTPVYSAPREWARVHPISPYLGSGPILGAVALYWLTRATPSWLAGNDEEYEALDRLPFLVLAGAVVVVVAAVVAFGVVSWRRNEYRIGDDAMYHRKGILFRQHRQARLDRIEAVDVVQPLLARVFGLARLNVQVAGGKGSAIELSFLRLGDAEALRNEVLALAAGAKSMPDAVVENGAIPGPAHSWSVTLGETSPTTEVPAAPARDVFTVPTRRLLGSVALSTPTLVLLVVAVGVVVALTVFGSRVGDALLTVIGTSVFAVVGFVAAVGGYFWATVNSGFHFTAATSTDGLHLRHGLAETRRQTVAPGRVQAVLVRQPPLWRRQGWYRVTMNVAGYQDDQQRVSTLLPVGTLAEVLLALELVLPDAAGETLERDVVGTGGEDGFTPSPRRARLMDPLQWRQRGVRAGEHALVIRSGRFTRSIAFVPHARTQSLNVAQGPFDRLRGVATFTVHSTPGPVSPVAAHLDLDAALALLDQQSARAREAIRA